MSCGYQNLFDEIFFLCAHTSHTDAAAFLFTISCQIDSFDVAAVRERNDNIIIID